MGNKKKVLFLVTEDWYFLSHRLPIAQQAQRLGYDVVVATRINDDGERLESYGFKIIPIHMKRSGRNIIGEFLSLFQIMGIYMREKPDIVHQVAVKPVIYGSIAALVFRRIKCINAIAGLGYVFSRTDKIKTKVVRQLFLAAYRLAFLSRAHAIFQNPEDKEIFIKNRIITEKKSVLIPGSGVDISLFKTGPEPEGSVVFMLASRMIWDKGIGELVEAAKQLKSKGVVFRLVLVGSPDKENPKAIPEKTLKQWHNDKIIEWWGFKSNMPEILNKAHIIVLPSYREGLPKILIEAASCGKPIVATDVPGCKEIVLHGKNGFLVQPKSVDALVDVMEKLIKDPGLRGRMGKYSRALVEKQFTDTIVIDKTIQLYKRVLA